MKEEQGFKGFLAFLSIVLTTPLMVWRGYAISVLWSWFVAGYFGLPQLGIARAVGISLLVGFLTSFGKVIPTKQSAEEAVDHFSSWVVLGIAGPALALIVGAIVARCL
jgi:hypothetical protein